MLHEQSKCIIEAEISINHSQKYLFTKHNLDYQEISIVRREITSNGKSRSFVNDTPSSLNIISKIFSVKIDIYVQNQSLSLTSPDKQYQLLDIVSHNKPVIKEYQSNLKEYQKLIKDLSSFKNNSKLSSQEIDHIKYQIKELEQAKLSKEEQETLENQFNIYNNASSIIESLNKSQHFLSSENGILSYLSKINNELLNIHETSSEIKEISSRTSSAMIEINDISSEIQKIYNSINFNQLNHEKIKERLDFLNLLLMKHGKNNISELIILLENLKSKIKNIHSFEDILKKKENRIIQKKKILNKISLELRRNREKAIPKFCKDVKAYLKELGIKYAQFNIKLDNQDEFSSYGKDRVSFLFSANQGSKMSPLDKVISGGEISRLLLSLSYLTSDPEDNGCMIFDEVDSGVSGRIANLMSDMLLKMSTKKQIIAISHLPQIAAKANHHLKVIKYNLKDKTISKVHFLNKEERINEIAILLSGKNVTSNSINNAKELLNL